MKRSRECWKKEGRRKRRAEWNSVGREDRTRKGHGERITKLRYGENGKNRTIKEKVQKGERKRL